MRAPLLLSGLAISAIAPFSATANATGSAEIYLPVPQQLYIEAGHCQVGNGGIFHEGLSNFSDLEGYLSNLPAAREDAIASADAASKAKASSSRSFLSSFFNGNRKRDRQVVYLEFNPGEPVFPVFFSDGTLFGVFPDYIYTEEDREIIQARLEEDYALYNYEFTQERPERGEFSTLTFGDNDAGNITLTPTGGLSILFGRAENIDFRNDDRSDNAFIDASLWRFAAELDRAFGTNNLENFSGIPVNGPEDIDIVEQIAVQNQSSNTGAHELGHIQGMRHHDSIGAPGTGLPIGVDPAAFLPVGETEQNADETLLHTMASGASVGLPLSGSTLQDRFFSERSAVKFALNSQEQRRARSERRARGWLRLTPLRTPNPVLEGENAGKRLVTRASLIEGRIDEVDQVDSYRFVGLRGEVFNAETISFSDTGFAEPIIGKLELSRLERDGTKTPLISNRLTFEGIEPLLFDFELPSTAVYVLEVSSPGTIDFGDGVPVPLSDFGLGGFEIGDYDLHAYIVDGKGRGR